MAPPKIQRRHKPQTRITDLTIRLRIHNSGNLSARYNAQRNRRRYRQQRAPRRTGLDLTLAHRSR